jgi:hypothetical protein
MISGRRYCILIFRGVDGAGDILHETGDAEPGWGGFPSQLRTLLTPITAPARRTAIWDNSPIRDGSSISERFLIAAMTPDSGLIVQTSVLHRLLLLAKEDRVVNCSFLRSSVQIDHFFSC